VKGFWYVMSKSICVLSLSFDKRVDGCELEAALAAVSEEEYPWVECFLVLV
jgi:hypothetical protein